MKKVNVMILSLAILLVTATSGFASLLVGSDTVSLMGVPTPFGMVGMGSASFTDINKSVLGELTLNVSMTNNLPGVASFYGLTGLAGTVLNSGAPATSYTGLFSGLKVDYRADGIYQFALLAYPLGQAPGTASVELFKTNAPVGKTPIPGAVWLLGSGLMGLLGLRKKFTA